MDSIEPSGTRATSRKPGAAPRRIALIDAAMAASWAALPSGFDHLLVPDAWRCGGEPGVIGSRHDAAATAAALGGVAGAGIVLVDLVIDCVAMEGDILRDHRELFEGPDASAALDPRLVPTPLLARPRYGDPGGGNPGGDDPGGVDPGGDDPGGVDEGSAERLGAWWGTLIAQWVQGGIGGVRLRGLAGLPQHAVRPLLRALRRHAGEAILLADTAAMPWSAIAVLGGIGLDGVMSSLAWWNWRDRWFEDELAMLKKIAPVFANLSGEAVRGDAVLTRALAYCAGHGLGWIAAPGDAAMDAARLAARLEGGRVASLNAPDAAIQVLLRTAADPRWSGHAALLLINSQVDRPAGIDPAHVLTATGGCFELFRGEDGSALVPGVVQTLEGGAWRLFEANALASPKPLPLEAQSAVRAAGWPRLAIENATPSVDGGLFAVKRTAGSRVEVEADVIGDGHDILSVALQWKGPGQWQGPEDTAWQESRMRLLGNDRWAAHFPLIVRGMHHYRIVAWRDHYATWRHELGAKAAAGVPIALELIEGLSQLRAAVARKAPGAAEIGAILASIETSGEAAQRDALLAPGLARLMDDADERPHSAVSVALPVDAERSGAGFASWYEVFPRSMSDDPRRHGTFADVERHLPRIRDMGFDVLYFPPIHPIGRINRKGPNNTLTPEPHDVGSPYAVGAAEGGHDAIHAELGTLEDFLHLRRAAEAHGLEIALDFAIQCAPDHPWLAEHKDWFAWRPDGTVRYAENPPKKYQDIVNVDFYADGAVPGLWLALANVVLYWAEQGIRLFRVDNPHTKPLPFWQWMIAEVRARYPDAVFLAEAFTRPKVMNRLAKVGFGQSYTYFTWRNSKAELTEYLTQLSTEAPKDFFRPHFFVNTPDINPVFLQTSGRPGYLIRAALAATLSGLWGVYNGFELCEGAALPGREEYLDSEKYQIRIWDWQRPGNIIAEITQLNRIRAQNPALHSHLDITFLPASNDTVLFYEKSTADRSNCVLCMVSLDPHHVQRTSIELPLWKWGLPDQARLQLEDLIGGDRFALDGKTHTVTLTPQQPYLIWRATPLS